MTHQGRLISRGDGVVTHQGRLKGSAPWLSWAIRSLDSLFIQKKKNSVHSEQGGAVDHTSSVYGLCVIRTFGPPNYSTAPDWIEKT